MNRDRVVFAAIVVLVVACIAVSVTFWIWLITAAMSC